MWVPLVLENNIDPNYLECLCPKCGETTVHHMGAPCQHYSCPKCGEMMELRGEHEKNIKESGMVRLPDGSGFFTGTVKTKNPKRVKKVSEELYKPEDPKPKKTFAGNVIPKSPPTFGGEVPSPMAAMGEDMTFKEIGNKAIKGDEPSRLYWASLAKLSTTGDDKSKCPEEIHDDIVKVAKKIYKEGELVEKYLNLLQTESFLGTMKKVGKKLDGSPGPVNLIHRAYWATKRGEKIPWPSQTGKQIASSIKSEL